MPSLNIIYQDENIIAINKPSGLLVHKSEVDKYEEENAMHMLRDQIGKRVYTVHRIDKPTSGVLLMALNKETANLLSEIFIKRAIKKKYFAIVRGYTDKQGTIDYPLNELTKKYKRKIQNTPKEANEAITNYHTIDQVELPIEVGRYSTSRYSLVEASPITGRSRQIRRHFKHIFHPIIGDTSHGDGKHNTLFREKFSCHRLLLHASQLTFIHPHTKNNIVISADLDESFISINKQLGFQY